MSLRDVGLDLETGVLSHSRSSDRQTDTGLSAEVESRKLTSSSYSASQLSDTDVGIFVNLYYFNISFRCLLVRVSGNMKKRDHAVAGISFSFRFINCC